MTYSLSTFIYKEIEETKIHADVYTPLCPVDSNAPVIMYIHGGYYIRGDRKTIPKSFVTEAVRRNWVVVSIDYRLAPETKQAEILQDVKDAYTWVHEALPNACSFSSIDTSRIIVVGGSAGGNAAVLSGYYCSPKPVALVGIYPYNDCRTISSEKSYSSEEFSEIQKLMQEIDATKTSPLPTGEPVKIELEDGVPTIYNVNFNSKRNVRNTKFRELGILAPLIIGFNPRSSENISKLEKLTPSSMINENYPPIYLVHGANDLLVPSEHPKEIESACKRLGVEVTLDIVPGAGHCFDFCIEDGGEVFRKHILPMFDFMAVKFQ
ncbi:alpha/beta-hydrolase [Basidiobolus meristosporus CBS 931.73]|uniref:Alpha/beta-hydrolase n=1 Tax=Basidiobolus meristosporus CBS 931.73 TaxID=1314790 RepID=A0A1Y1Z792_9FUNG|nr:alpha/beta-hydrolase [Basidiobolus meristosporus CBS 931.73]|eukprot:ORY05867.1 alpha/beta-hydrolase [Basidiobolus meristosporus CBS 931.73]